MIQDTIARGEGWLKPSQQWVVTNQVQAKQARAQLPELPTENVLIEPCGRNTAPCIGLAAIHILHRDPDGVMLVMPADHVIRPNEKFREAAQRAAAVVAQQPETFVLFGVVPTYPSTGFGYIQRTEETQGSYKMSYLVRTWREEPHETTASSYLKAGSYYWNCGIFVWRARAILDALKEYEPEMYAGLVKIADSLGKPDEQDVLHREFPKLNSISVDYAVLERSPNTTVIEAPFEWDDLGSWYALPRLLGQDDNQNTIDGPHVGLQTRGCIIRTDDNHLVATIGLEDCIVVHTPDATLVARRDDENAVKQLVALIEERGYGRFL